MSDYLTEARGLGMRQAQAQARNDAALVRLISKHYSALLYVIPQADRAEAMRAYTSAYRKESGIDDEVRA